jgi:branched-subunit amino acid aminotransferase/4-amino-4-deoxychorismate lyase
VQSLLSAIPDWIEDVRARGARAVSLLGVRASAPWLLPGVKSTSYAVNMAAEAEAKRRGADDAIFVDPDGVVLEGTVTNVWWRKGKALRTPSLDLGILAGVTRQTLLELAGPCGYRVEEGTFGIATSKTPTRSSPPRPSARSCRSSSSTSGASTRCRCRCSAAGTARAGR